MDQVESYGRMGGTKTGAYSGLLEFRSAIRSDITHCLAVM